MVSGDRYVTQELLQLDQALANALSQAIAREESVYVSLLAKLQTYHACLLQLSKEIAALDMQQSHAFTALRASYCPCKSARRLHYRCLVTLL